MAAGGPISQGYVNTNDREAAGLAPLSTMMMTTSTLV